MTKKIYENYWQSNPEHLHDFLSKWPKLKRFISADGGVVVDFGCGNGKILEEIRKINSKARLVGLDVSGTALSQARENLPEAEFYKIEDGGEFPLPDNSVDFIFSSEVVEHIYDTENAFLELARILKPGGRILLTTPYNEIRKGTKV